MGPDPGGTGLAQALWLNTYTCDVSLPTVERARARYPQAHVYYAESTDFLREVLPIINNQRTFFFLDAHFPEFVEYEAESTHPRWPVYEEMQLIKQLKVGYEHDVIWIDDIFCIVDDLNPRYREPEMHGSLLAQRDRPFSDYLNVFADTHHPTTYIDFEGVLAFYPRSLP